MSKEIWTTKDGKKIPIDKLTDKHLGNLIKFMDKWHDNIMFNLMSMSSIVNGEIALYDLEQTIDTMLNGECHCEACRWKITFIDEMERRSHENNIAG